jgi:DNA-binding CsgD family transcriptional regulator
MWQEREAIVVAGRRGVVVCLLLGSPGGQVSGDLDDELFLGLVDQVQEFGFGFGAQNHYQTPAMVLENATRSPTFFIRRELTEPGVSRICSSEGTEATVPLLAARRCTVPRCRYSGLGSSTRPVRSPDTTTSYSGAPRSALIMSGTQSPPGRVADLGEDQPVRGGVEDLLVRDRVRDNWRPLTASEPGTRGAVANRMWKWARPDVIGNSRAGVSRWRLLWRVGPDNGCLRCVGTVAVRPSGTATGMMAFMTRGRGDLSESNTNGAVSYAVLSRTAITLWAVIIVAAGVGMAIWLLTAYGGNDANTQLNAIRTAGTIVVGTGGAAALLLAARRQRATEIALTHTEAGLRQKDRDQEHQLRVTVATEADAEARRITELYTTAAGQLGSDKAPVRLAGLYALERLAQNNLSQRQTIVNVLCAYLRMPFTIPAEPPPAGAGPQLATDHTERIQEREVRLTAQRVLRDHLRPGGPDAEPVDSFWPGIDLDLTRATLIDFDVDHCQMRAAAFRQARFVGIASFHEARFTGVTSFRESRFADSAFFQNTQFDDHASFVGVQFADGDATTFNGTRFMDVMPDEVAPFWSPPSDDRDIEQQALVGRPAVPLTPTGISTATELSNRERVLLALLSSGSTDQEVAAELGLSVRTVRRMVSDLMHQLGARSRFAAGVHAIDRGWLLLQRPET